MTREGNQNFVKILCSFIQKFKIDIGVNPINHAIYGSNQINYHIECYNLLRLPPSTDQAYLEFLLSK